MDQVMTWISDNQELILSYTVKFIVAIIILIVGKIVANSVAKLMGKGMEKRGTDKAVISFLGAIVRSVIFIAAYLRQCH